MTPVAPTKSKDNSRGETLTSVLAELGIDGSLRGRGDSSDQAEEGAKDNTVEDRHFFRLDGSNGRLSGDDCD